MTAWLPGQVRWCVLCGVHTVQSSADYTCPTCPSEKPCPTGTKWSSTPLGGPTRWMNLGARVDEQAGGAA